jgi:hypothetical protein
MSDRTGLCVLQEEELEKEEEEPDRLSLLLPQSKFDCTAKKTGYYADDGLNCEVFHYCQDNARHSWICPEGFVFHQARFSSIASASDSPRLFFNSTLKTKLRVRTKPTKGPPLVGKVTANFCA